MSDVELDVPENAPLMGAGEWADEPISSKPRFRARRWQAQTPGMIVFLTVLIKFSLVCSGMLMMVPVYRLIEDAICHVELGDDSNDLIEEMKCKTDAVQTRLVYLIGWVGLFNSVVSLIIAYPYGMLADRMGRKPTALLAYTGLAASFLFAPVMFKGTVYAIRHNPYLLLLGSLFLLVGGGPQVLIATLYAIAADVSEEKDKAASFLYLTFGATAGGLLGPLLAGGLMARYGPWVPIYVVIATAPFVFIIFLFLPETLMTHDKTEHETQAADKGTLKEQIGHGLRDLASSFSMLKNVNIPLILITFLFQNARFHAYTSMLAQYLSKHFGWRLAETSILLSPLGLLNLIVLASLPKLSQILMSSRFGFSGFGKDLFLTRVSTALIVVGAVIETFSRDSVSFMFGLFIGTFGAADSPLARATITHYVEPEYTSRLYALISMTEVLGALLAGPVLAGLFDTGLRWRGIWTGLPWFYIGVLCAIALAALAFVRPPRRIMLGDDGDLDEQERDGLFSG